MRAGTASGIVAVATADACTASRVSLALEEYTRSVRDVAGRCGEDWLCGYCGGPGIPVGNGLEIGCVTRATENESKYHLEKRGREKKEFKK